MDIEAAGHIEHAEWERIVSEDDRAAFFHTPEWSDLLVSTLPGFEVSHLVAREGGRAVAVMPVLARPRFGVRTLESMAFGTFGGPVCAGDAPAGAASALLRRFAAEAVTGRTGRALVVDRHRGFDARDLPGFDVSDDTVQVVSLDRDHEEIRAGYTPSARNKIRKALKADVTVRRARSESDFVAYYRVLEECSRDWNVRPRPGLAFFSALSTLDPSRVQMWLAEHEGAVIGGDLNFALHGTVMNWGNVSTDDAKALAPSNLLHATAIEEGVRDGRKLYDLGSSAGIEGVRKFKASFGTKDVPVRSFVLEAAWYRAARTLRDRRRGETA